MSDETNKRPLAPQTHVAGITLSQVEVKALLYGVPKVEFSMALKRMATWLAEVDDTPPPTSRSVGATRQDDFEAWAKTRALDVTKEDDAWGRTAYKYSHIGAMWDGWQAADETQPPEPREAG